MLDIISRNFILAVVRGLKARIVLCRSVELTELGTWAYSRRYLRPFILLVGDIYYVLVAEGLCYVMGMPAYVCLGVSCHFFTWLFLPFRDKLPGLNGPHLQQKPEL